jgi:hypothetical protein
MNLRTLGLACFILSSLVLGACENQPALPKSSAVQSTSAARAEADGVQKPSLETTPAIGFSPDDPNTFARNPESIFPQVRFTVEGVPTGSSDRYNYSLSVRADPSISHYAYKVASTAACNQTGGYAVFDTQTPIKINIDEMPIGTVHLCVIGFHFPTKQWQDMSKALAFSWQKIDFNRTIDTYYEAVDGDCNNAKIRFNVSMTIEGKMGTMTIQRMSVPNCINNYTEPYAGRLSKVQVTESTMEGSWHEGPDATQTGWFKFTWTDRDRKEFKGFWGFGPAGITTAGVWNSKGQ